jgi:hypothetical protein
MYENIYIKLDADTQHGVLGPAGFRHNQLSKLFQFRMVLLVEGTNIIIQASLFGQL